MAETIDQRDAILQALAPAVMVPHYSNFPPIERDGHRYLVAQDGLWLEVRRPWLHLLWPLSAVLSPLPFGPVLSDEMELAFEIDRNETEFGQCMAQFEIDAARAMPLECAAWFVWNNNTQSLEYWPLVSRLASVGYVEFDRPALLDHQHLAVDIHSHAADEAYFSPIDDKDDAGEVKLTIVLGRVGAPDQHCKMRLCAHGLFIPIEGYE